MAQAADGATKQNRAIADLGLNTAELLAMPVEQQIQAIARAYTNATDKGKAWADVTALLGRNSARLKEVLEQIAANGLDADGSRFVSDADIERLDKAEVTLSKMALSMKVVGAGIVASLSRAADAVNDFQFFDSKSDEQNDARNGSGGFHGDGHGKDGDSPEEHKAKVAAIQAELEATIQSTPQMIAAHQALEKALKDESKAYEGPAQAAARMRSEAAADIDQAYQLAQNKGDSGAQLESVKLRTEAAKLETQANQEDAKAAKETLQYAAAEAEMAQKRAQAATALLPIDNQLVQASTHKLELEQRLAGLDATSQTYRQDHLKTEGELLAVDQQISALKEKESAQYVEQLAKEQDAVNKRAAIAIAAVEHDANKSDTEKWEEKRQILAKVLDEQNQYIVNMQALAGSSNVPQGARDKAGQAAESGQTTAQGTKEQLGAMGPNPTSFTANFSSDLTKLQKQWGTLQQNMASGLSGTIARGFSSASTNLTKLIMGAETLGQAFRNIAVDIEESFVQAFVDAGVKWVATEAMKLAFGASAKASDTATSVAAAEVTGLAWSVPAALASVASFGAADIAGMIGLTAAVTEAATIGAVGFADGGFTGGMEGQAAGIVHGQEFVWSAPAVRAVGAGNLERAHQAALSGGGGVSTGGKSSGAPGNIILAMSPEDVAKSQRKHVDARVQKISSKQPKARVAL